MATEDGKFLRLYKRHCSLPGRCEGISRRNETCTPNPLNPATNHTLNKVIFKIQLENVSIAELGSGRELMTMISRNQSLYNRTLKLSSAFLSALVARTNINITKLEVTSIKRASCTAKGCATMDYFVTMAMSKTESLTKSEIRTKLGSLKTSSQSQFNDGRYIAQISPKSNISLSGM